MNDDDDIGAVFKHLHKQKQAKRAGNRESSASILVNRGIPFDSRNNGAHLIVRLPDGAGVDFWPGTGRWKFRGIHNDGFGVFNLLKELEKYNVVFRINTPNTQDKE